MGLEKTGLKYALPAGEILEVEYCKEVEEKSRN